MNSGSLRICNATFLLTSTATFAFYPRHQEPCLSPSSKPKSPTLPCSALPWQPGWAGTLVLKTWQTWQSWQTLRSWQSFRFLLDKLTSRQADMSPGQNTSILRATNGKIGRPSSEVRDRPSFKQPAIQSPVPMLELSTRIGKFSRVHPRGLGCLNSPRRFAGHNKGNDVCFEFVFSYYLDPWAGGSRPQSLSPGTQALRHWINLGQWV